MGGGGTHLIIPKLDVGFLYSVGWGNLGRFRVHSLGWGSKMVLSKDRTGIVQPEKAGLRGVCRATSRL